MCFVISELELTTFTCNNNYLSYTIQRFLLSFQATILPEISFGILMGVLFPRQSFCFNLFLVYGMDEDLKKSVLLAFGVSLNACAKRCTCFLYLQLFLEVKTSY